MRLKANRETAARYVHISLDRVRFLPAVEAQPIEFIPSQREAHGITALPLTEEDVLYLPKIPKLHRDPFDRMLICQAIVNGFTVLTPDQLISQYPIRTLW